MEPFNSLFGILVTRRGDEPATGAFNSLFGIRLLAEAQLSAGMPFNSLFGIRKAANSMEARGLISLSTPFSGFSRLLPRARWQLDVFQLPFRDSEGRTVKEAYDEMLPFNSLFGIQLSCSLICPQATPPFNSLFGIRYVREFKG